MSDKRSTGSFSSEGVKNYGQPVDKEVVAMGMMDYVKVVYNKYTDFSGRARRSEYWYFTLFNSLIVLALYIPVIALIAAQSSYYFVPLIIITLFSLAVVLPSIAVAVRRLHDTGRSGWFYLVGLIPLVGGVILLVFLIADSQPGTNSWGPNPKNPDGGEFEKL